LVSFKRRIIQTFSAILANSNFLGFINGTIYRGNLKKLCYPGLNCYSCPGALGACPIGSLQSLAAGLKFNVSLYVLGFLALIGTFTGRLVCGFLCPFGFFQELLYKIPSKKISIHKNLNYLKYVFLLVFVLILPAVLVNEVGFGTQYFCKYICPAGTLEAGIPLAIANNSIRNALGLLFGWKFLVLLAVIILAIHSKRPFCRTMCPLGAIYSIFNPISVYRLKVDNNKCTKCDVCKHNCPVDIRVYENPNSIECVRCGECKKGCPQNVIKEECRL